VLCTQWQLELQRGLTRLFQIATISAPAAVWCACEKGSEEAAPITAGCRGVVTVGRESSGADYVALLYEFAH